MGQHPEQDATETSTPSQAAEGELTNQELEGVSGGTRENVGTIGGAPRIGAQARLDAVSTTVQGSSGAKS